MDPGDEATQVLGSFAKTIGMIVSAILICVLFAFLGSMSYPGLGAVVGGLIGFPVGLVIGFFACGKYKEVLETADDMVDAQMFVPEAFHEGLFGHQRFTLYVTVHRIEGAAVKRGPAIFGGSDFFIRTICGRNPPKTTCVRETGVWNETFKLTVEAQDSSVTFEVIDQNTLIDTKVASVAVPISTIVGHIGAGEVREKLQSKSKQMGVLIVSFKAGEDISSTHQIPRNLCVQDTTVGGTSGARLYGTFANPKSAYFNTNPSTGVSAYTKPGTADSVRPMGSRDHLQSSTGSGRGAPPRQPTQKGARSPFSSGMG
jgi:hypothetical protein